MGKSRCEHFNDSVRPDMKFESAAFALSPAKTLHHYNFNLDVTIFLPRRSQALLISTRHITKSRLYDFLHPWFKTGLLTSTGLVIVENRDR